MLLPKFEAGKPGGECGSALLYSRALPQFCGRRNPVASAAARSSCWPPVVSAAAGALAPVGFKHLGAAASTLILKIRLLSACRLRRREKMPRVFIDGACAPAEEVPARAAAGPAPLVRRRVGLRAWATAGYVSRLRRVAWAAAGSAPRLRRVVHLRTRHRCRDCGGASICEHGRMRAECRDCGGTSVCEHGRRRHQCRDCGGSSFRAHGRIGAATAAARRSASMGDCGTSAATAPVLYVKLRAVHPIRRSAELAGICKRCTATTRAQ